MTRLVLPRAPPLCRPQILRQLSSPAKHMMRLARRTEIWCGAAAAAARLVAGPVVADPSTLSLRARGQHRRLITKTNGESVERKVVITDTMRQRTQHNSALHRSR